MSQELFKTRKENENGDVFYLTVDDLKHEVFAYSSKTIKITLTAYLASSGATYSGFIYSKATIDSIESKSQDILNHAIKEKSLWTSSGLTKILMRHMDAIFPTRSD